MAPRLHRFHGGLSLPAHKAVPGAEPIRPCPLPATLVLPLLQHAGAIAGAVVAAGEVVVAGQLLARAEGRRGADLHAPAAGRVRAIEDRPLASMPGMLAPHVVLDLVPGQPAPVPLPAHPLPPLDPFTAPRVELLERIRQAGIAGLGGAGFPAAEKLAVARETLIVNGAECEPYLTCDERLLRERAALVVRGSRLLQRIVGASRVLLAVEDRMLEALESIRFALDAEDADGIELVAVPTIYPEGGERQLIQVLTGAEVPRGGLPRDIGIVVHNVATAAAAWRAVTEGVPLCSRIVTVTGAGVARPGNYEVAIGTPIAHLVEAAGGYTPAAMRLVLGGPMMGQALANDGFPVTKTSHCVLVLGRDEVAATGPEMPCIRCGDCADVCPARLLPQQLLWHVRAEDLQRGRSEGLPDCIECGCCDLVCPSHIPLTQHFRHARTELRRRDQEAADAEAARQRFEARAARAGRIEAERARRAAARQAALSSPDAVSAAIARARARKHEP